MKWRKYLPVPKKHRRTRSEARSGAGSVIEDSSDAGLVTLRPTGSAPDLSVGASILPTSRDPHPIPDQIQSVPGRGGNNRSKSPDHTLDPKAASENKPSWKSTAYAATKLAINIVKESSDAFPPLKSVVGGLSAILSHCDVWYTSHVPLHPGSLWLS